MSDTFEDSILEPVAIENPYPNLTTHKCPNQRHQSTQYIDPVATLFRKFTACDDSSRMHALSVKPHDASGSSRVSRRRLRIFPRVFDLGAKSFFKRSGLIWRFSVSVECTLDLYFPVLWMTYACVRVGVQFISRRYTPTEAFKRTCSLVGRRFIPFDDWNSCVADWHRIPCCARIETATFNDMAPPSVATGAVVARDVSLYMRDASARS